MNESKPVEPPPGGKLRCEYCEKESLLVKVEIQHPKLPNTLTELDDVCSTIWKCLHCGCWQ